MQKPQNPLHRIPGLWVETRFAPRADKTGKFQPHRKKRIRRLSQTCQTTRGCAAGVVGGQPHWGTWHHLASGACGPRRWGSTWTATFLIATGSCQEVGRPWRRACPSVCVRTRIGPIQTNKFKPGRLLSCQFGARNRESVRRGPRDMTPGVLCPRRFWQAAGQPNPAQRNPQLGCRRSPTSPSSNHRVPFRAIMRNSRQSTPADPADGVMLELHWYEVSTEGTLNRKRFFCKQNIAPAPRCTGLRLPRQRAGKATRGTGPSTAAGLLWIQHLLDIPPPPFAGAFLAL